MPSMSFLDVYPKEVLRKLANEHTPCGYLQNWELELEKCTHKKAVYAWF